MKLETMTLKRLSSLTDSQLEQEILTYIDLKAALFSGYEKGLNSHELFKQYANDTRILMRELEIRKGSNSFHITK